MKRRRWTDREKARIAIGRGNESVPAYCRSKGINPSLYYRWRAHCSRHLEETCRDLYPTRSEITGSTILRIKIRLEASPKDRAAERDEAALQLVCALKGQHPAWGYREVYRELEKEGAAGITQWQVYRLIRGCRNLHGRPGRPKPMKCIQLPQRFADRHLREAFPNRRVRVPRDKLLQAVALFIVGLPRAEIARLLNLDPKTITLHLESIFRDGDERWKEIERQLRGRFRRRWMALQTIAFEYDCYRNFRDLQPPVGWFQPAFFFRQWTQTQVKPLVISPRRKRIDPATLRRFENHPRAMKELSPPTPREVEHARAQLERKVSHILGNTVSITTNRRKIAVDTRAKAAVFDERP